MPLDGSHAWIYGEPSYLSLRQLLRRPPDWPVAGRSTHVCESPDILVIAADHLDAACAPLLRTDGMPAAAQRILLDQLVGAGARLCYHGGYDGPANATTNRRESRRSGMHGWPRPGTPADWRSPRRRSRICCSPISISVATAGDRRSRHRRTVEALYPESDEPLPSPLPIYPLTHGFRWIVPPPSARLVGGASDKKRRVVTSCHPLPPDRLQGS